MRLCGYTGLFESVNFAYAQRYIFAWHAHSFGIVVSTS